jgi:hypothetical protein
MLPGGGVDAQPPSESEQPPLELPPPELPPPAPFPDDALLDEQAATAPASPTSTNIPPSNAFTLSLLMRPLAFDV